MLNVIPLGLAKDMVMPCKLQAIVPPLFYIAAHMVHPPLLLLCWLDHAQHLHIVRPLILGLLQDQSKQKSLLMEADQALDIEGMSLDT